MRTINVEDDVWEELTKLKLALLAKNLSGVVQYMLTERKLKGDPSPVNMEKIKSSPTLASDEASGNQGDDSIP